MTRYLSMKTLITVLAVAGLLAGPLVAGARGKGGHGGPRLEQQIERLDLDEATRASVYQILDASRPARRAVRAELREARKRMHELMSQDQPDETAVMAQVDTLGEIKTRAKKLKIADMLKVHALLSPDQRAQLREMRGKSKRRGGRHTGARRDDTEPIEIAELRSAAQAFAPRLHSGPREQLNEITSPRAPRR